MGLGVNWDLDYNASQSGGGGGSGGLASLMEGLEKATPWYVNPLAAAGGLLLSGVGDLLSGPTEAQKRARSVYDLAQNRMGQPVIDPTQYLAQYMQALAPRFNRQAEKIGSRLGLDSGLAQKEIAGSQQSVLSGILADLDKFNAQATANQDMGLMRLMSRAGSMS